MATTTRPASPAPTPSKKVTDFSSRRVVYVINFLLQAAAALAAFTLESPTKPSKKEAVVLIDDEKRSQSPESVTDATDTLPDFRRKFVGEVDLPES